MFRITDNQRRCIGTRGRRLSRWEREYAIWAMTRLTAPATPAVVAAFLGVHLSSVYRMRADMARRHAAASSSGRRPM